MFLKKIGKFFLWIAFLLIFTLGAGTACLYIFQDEIKQLAIEKINSKINTKISVNQIDLSFIKYFPFASINFQNITIKDSYQNSKNNLIEAQEISLVFNIWNMVDKNYVIHKIYIKNGKINLKVNSQNVNNFQILKPDTSGSTSFNLNLKLIELKNMEIIYEDKFTPQYYSVFTEKSILNGNFNDSVFDLNIESDFFVDEIIFKHFSYLKSKTCTAKLNLLVNQNKNSYSIKNAQATIEKLKFDVDGEIQIKPNGVFSNLKIQSTNLDLEKMIAVIPNYYAEKFKNFYFNGVGNISVKIKGLYSEKFFFNVESKGEINISKLSTKLDKLKGRKFSNLKFNYIYSNGSKQNDSTSSIQIKNIETNYENEILKGQVIIRNFNNPFIDLDLNGTLGLEQMLPLLSQPKIKSLSGKMLVDIHFSGLLKDFSEVDGMNRLSAFGNIELQNGGIQLSGNNLNFNNLNGNFKFDKSDLIFNNFSSKVSNSDFFMVGKIINIFPYLLKKDQGVEIVAKVKSNNIDLDELMQATGPNGNKDSLYRIKISPKINFSTNLDCKKINFQKFIAQNLIGDFIINNQVLRSDYFSLNTMNGFVNGKVSVNASHRNNLLINSDLSLENINIKKMFYSFGNFGQEYIVDKNINGSLHATISISSIWTNDLQFIPDKFYSKANLSIENGELINFEPLQALSKYVNVEELKNLKFQSMKNEIEIKNQIINIPTMDIKNNALNVSVYGIHGFENTFDYHLKIKLSELLNKKRKNKVEDEFGPIEEDVNGGTTLFLRMYGTNDNILFSVDKSAIKKKIGSDLFKEGQEIKNIFKDEFKSIFKNGNQNNFKEELSKESWENDMPGTPTQKKSESANPNLKNKAVEKSKLQKLKEKLKEQDEPDN